LCAALKALGSKSGEVLDPTGCSQHHRENKQGAYVHRRWYVRTAAKYFLQEC